MACNSVWWLYAVISDKILRARNRPRQARSGDGPAFGFERRKLEVQPKEKGEGIFVFLHSVSGADGGVEGGVGVAEAVGAGGFEGAIEVAQGPAVGGRDLAAGTPKVSIVSTPHARDQRVDGARGQGCRKGSNLNGGEARIQRVAPLRHPAIPAL